MNRKIVSALLAACMAASLAAPAMAEETAPEAAPEELVLAETTEAPQGEATSNEEMELEGYAITGGETFGQAETIAVNKTHSVTVTGDTWFKFTIPQDGGVSIETSVYSGQIALTMYECLDDGSCGVQIGEEVSAAEFSTPYFGLRKGSYYIKTRINLWGCRESRYSLIAKYQAGDNYEGENNGLISKAQSVELGKTYNAVMDDSGDVDFYKFTLQQAGKANFTLDCAITAGSLTGGILTEDEVSLYTLALDSRSATYSGYSVGLPAGTYYLKVSSRGLGANKPYKMTINFTPSATWESESNNDIAKADPITLGTDYSGVITDSDDKDWYTFTTDKTGNLTLNFQNETVSTGSNSWYVYLYKVNNGLQGDEIMHGTAKAVNSKAVFEANDLAAGSYAVLIKGNYSGIEGLQYTINVTLADAAQPTAAPTAKPTAAPTAAPSVNTEGTDGFVDRLYSVCLGRAADDAGKANWVGQLTSYQISGTKAAYGFIFSEEFTNKNYSNADYVEHLYEAFMGRASDEGGKADWVSKLDAGANREEVFNGFANSVEFDNICKSYGIVSKDIETFVTRLYSVCLDRQPDDAGLADWANQLRSQTISGKAAASGFVFSEEFTSKNYSNADYVEHLYAAFMGRASDEGGKADWVSKLDAGTTREEVFNGFADSAEFDNICASYGIVRG